MTATSMRAVSRKAPTVVKDTLLQAVEQAKYAVCMKRRGNHTGMSISDIKETRRG